MTPVSNTPSDPWYADFFVGLIAVLFIFALVGIAWSLGILADWFWGEVVCEKWIVCQ